jgi:hypothetical protein
MKPIRERLLLEGLASGVLGYLVVAGFYAALNLLAGRPLLHTASVLGEAVFHGLRDAAAATGEVGPALAYNGAHMLVFALLGLAAARIVLAADRHPRLYYGVFVSVLAFLVAASVLVAALSAPVAAAVPGWSVVVANVLAVAAMGSYLWRLHPELRAALAGEPEDEAGIEPVAAAAPAAERAPEP